MAPLRCRVALATCAALLGCGATPGPVEPASVEPASREPTRALAPAPVLSRVSLVEHSTSLDVTLDSLYLGDGTQPGRADLHVGEEYFTLSMPGCAQGGGFGWSIEQSGPGPAPWARFVRTAVLPVTDGSDQAAHELAITGALTAFGHRVTPQRIELRSGGAVVFVFATTHPDVAEGSPQPHEQLLAPGVTAEQTLGQQILQLTLGDGELLGCPTLELALLDPRSQIVDVADGATGTVRTFGRLRMGDVTIRWEGLGHAMLRGGGGRAMFFFRGSVGQGAEESFTCMGDQPCDFHGVSVEPIEIGLESTFRLRRGPPQPQPQPQLQPTTS